MAVPVASNNIAPITNAGKGANHQKIKPPTLAAFTPPYYVPVPVGAVLQGGVTGTAYSETITAQGGTSPYTFAKTAGTLPTGLSLSSAGVISGTPTATGTFSFTVTVTDANGYTGANATSFQIIVTAPSAGGAGGSFTFVS